MSASAPTNALDIARELEAWADFGSPAAPSAETLRAAAAAIRYMERAYGVERHHRVTAELEVKHVNEVLEAQDIKLVQLQKERDHFEACHIAGHSSLRATHEDKGKLLIALRDSRQTRPQ